ncbi:Rcd2, partial [Drosophila busckii]
ETIIELSVGTGQPGNCCTKYACAPEPTCEGAGINYWPDKCTKCNSCQIPNCISIKNCAPPTHASGCHHEDGTQSLNGETWREGICTLCKCENG